eukprot:1156564-Pelagomonas_calceolata.AAC.7
MAVAAGAVVQMWAIGMWARRSAKAVFMAASTRDVPGTLFWGRRRHGGSCLASLAMLSGGRLRV